MNLGFMFMKPNNEFYLWFSILGLMSAAFTIFTWLLFRRPEFWKAVATKEHAFWLRHASPAFADKTKRFNERMRLEPIIKAIILITTIIGVGSFLFFTVLLVWSKISQHG